MKNIYIYFLILMSLVACVSKSAGNWKCNPDGQVCVYINANEPVLYGAPVVVTITVTSDRDISVLGASLEYYTNVDIDGVENWEENLLNPYIYPGLAGWDFAINANQSRTFTRTLYLPSEEGHFYILASVGDKESFRVSNGLTIVMTRQGGTVYLANTPIPQTPGRLSTLAPEELATLLAMPTYTPWPTITPRPATGTPAAYPPPTTPDYDQPGTPYP
jgi:hypothetical protein